MKNLSGRKMKTWGQGLLISSLFSLLVNDVEGGNVSKLFNGTLITAQELSGNKFSSASVGVIAYPPFYCVGVLVSNQLFVAGGQSYCKQFKSGGQVKLGSLTLYSEPGFDGQTYNFTGIVTLPTTTDFQLGNIQPVPSNTIAKVAAVPPAALETRPPPVGSKCFAFGYSQSSGPFVLNRWPVTIVDILTCVQLWKVYKPTAVVKQDGSQFCAYTTEDGTPNSPYNFCGGDLLPPVFCQSWGAIREPNHIVRGRGGGGGKVRGSGSCGNNNNPGPPGLSYVFAGILNTQSEIGICGATNSTLPPVVFDYSGILHSFV